MMKKAVITTGGKQYLVQEGDVLEVEKLSAEKKLTLHPLLAIDGEIIKVGAPTIEGAQVNVEILQSDILADKVVAIRYKSKKRVKKTRGHRQRLSQIKILSIK